MSEVVTRPAANGADHQRVCGTDHKPTARVCFKCGEAKPLNEFAKGSVEAPGAARHLCGVQDGL